MQPDPPAGTEAWPELPLAAWADTHLTLRMWAQIVGKVRLALAPMLNHWWQATLYVTSRGLTTSTMPYGGRFFQIDFDFLDHELQLLTDDGVRRTLALAPRSVADFYAELMAALRDLDLGVRIWRMPVEFENPIPFDEDREHASYDPRYAERCWRVLEQATRVLERSRSDFLGKSSPVLFFWGGFDLALTRFSGRRAPVHPGGVPHLADRVVREAYSHEVSSVGWWPGGDAIAEPAFFAYAYPEPEGYRDYPVQPAAAFYSDELREYLLPYEAVRQAADPDALLLAFAQSTYEAAAELGGWDRQALERPASDPHRAKR